LENALSLYAPSGCRAASKSFFDGLSLDELQYLAEFLGSCILITSEIDVTTWDTIRHRAKVWQRRLASLDQTRREDLEHKLILVTEFAARCGADVSAR